MPTIELTSNFSKIAKQKRLQIVLHRGKIGEEKEKLDLTFQINANQSLIVYTLGYYCVHCTVLFLNNVFMLVQLKPLKSLTSNKKEQC